MRSIAIAISAVAVTLCAYDFVGTTSAAPTTQPATQVPLEFHAGHETDGRDRGRPVILIASALGVSADVFRDAFSHVHPARGGGGPTEAEARSNKDALLSALSKYGVTNDRLDEVSNYYRYRRENGEMWTHRDAVGYATIESGKVVSVTITDAGAGYSSVPSVTAKDHSEAKLIAAIVYGTDLKTNGHIGEVKLADVPATLPAR